MMDCKEFKCEESRVALKLRVSWRERLIFWVQTLIGMINQSNFVHIKEEQYKFYETGCYMYIEIRSDSKE